MPSRRALLAAVAAGLAGCNADRNAGTGSTVTAVRTPTEDPYPGDVADRLGSSRFEESAVCPAAIPCFHQIDGADRPETLVVPASERVTPESPTVSVRSYNFGDEDLVVAADTLVAKHTDITWAITVPFHETTTTRVIPPGESLTREFGLEGRGDGRYAVVERAGWGGPRGTVGMTLESRFGSDRFRFGAMIEVSGSDWTPSPAGVAAERDGETLHLLPTRSTEDRLVLEAADQDVGVPLVPETVAAHPPTNDAVLGLRRAGVTRTTTPTPAVSIAYLRTGLLYSEPIDPDRVIRLGDTLFTAHVE
jgi:hypothetical protein